MSVRSIAVSSAGFLVSHFNKVWRRKALFFLRDVLLPESKLAGDAAVGAEMHEPNRIQDEIEIGVDTIDHEAVDGSAIADYVPFLVEDDTILFFDIGTIPKLRGQSMLTKEPDTIAWINQFNKGDVFWDIGANVGVFTLYAAIKRSARVLAFEPAAGNYMVLNKNIEGNNLSERVSAYCVAFNDVDLLSELNMQNTEFGASLSGFATQIDFKGDKFSPLFRQGMIGFSIDNFVSKFSPEFPNHIKIDVDGIEPEIIQGAQEVLRDKRLKSLSVELNMDLPDMVKKVVTSIESCGMCLSDKAKVMRTKKSSIENYHFYR